MLHIKYEGENHMYNLKKLGIRILTPLIALFTIVSYTIPANAATMSNMNETKSFSEKSIQLADKMEKFVKRQGNSYVLTTHDTKTLGISQKELTDFEKGLQLAKKITVKESSSAHMATPSNSINHSVSIVTDSYGWEIQFSPTDVRVMMTVGITAGCLVGIAGLIFGGDGAIAVVCGYTITQSAFIATLGGALGASVAIWQTWWNGNGFTLYLPYKTILEESGGYLIGPGSGTEFWNDCNYYELN